MSSKQPIVLLNSVGKRYRKQSLLLKESIMETIHGVKHDSFWAVRNVSMQLQSGESIGLIGKNGSGKSTLLKLIAGVTVPTEGSVYIKGALAPLIELGAGFHFELTGRENIWINGTILGLTDEQIDARMDSIIEFAELIEFIDTPVKHYSSGMFMRLAFAVAIHVDPEVLLVDEILAVGDIAFQKKCLDRIRNMKQRGVGMVMVSHSMEQLEEHCDRGVVLDGGMVAYEGSIKKSIAYYRASLENE